VTLKRLERGFAGGKYASHGVWLAGVKAAIGGV
jgi:hypothetical protein